METVLGTVFFKDYQKDKIQRSDRYRFLGMVRPTLESPSFIVREIDGSEDGSDAFEFFKIFKKAGKNDKWFMSAVVHKEGDTLESVSSHVSKIGQARSRLTKFPLAYSAVAEISKLRTYSARGLLALIKIYHRTQYLSTQMKLSTMRKSHPRMQESSRSAGML